MVHCLVSHLDEGLILLTFRGSLDTATAPRSHSCLMDAADSGEGVIVDLTAVEYIDESGLYALGAALRESRGLGREFIIVAQPASRVAEALEAGLIASARVVDSLKSALSWAQSSRLTAAS